MPVAEEERLARVTLNAVGEPGSLRLIAMAAEHGPVGLVERLRGGDVEVADDLAQRLAALDPAVVLAEAAAAGLRFVVPGDEEWPSAVEDLRHGPELHERGGTPLGLWVKGPLHLARTVEQAVAVVGSRSATTYGTQVAGDLAAGLAVEGHTVVSGAAFGIDQAGHRAALAMGGATVAVLACGADRVYPRAHERLVEHIAETGLVVSETAVGGAPMRVRFLARNRLIAAMTRGTVVVEAAIRSGALNTASWADGLGRVVMGVPGPVTSAPSQGVHELIRTRGALLVTRAADVLEAVAPMGEQLVLDLREPARPRDRLSADERQVLDAVPVAHPVPAERIARVAGLSPGTVTAALRRLHDAGLVREQEGRWWLHVREPG
jgi:DNA processing protein